MGSVSLWGLGAGPPGPVRHAEPPVRDRLPGRRRRHALCDVARRRPGPRPRPPRRGEALRACAPGRLRTARRTAGPRRGRRDSHWPPRPARFVLGARRLPDVPPALRHRARRPVFRASNEPSKCPSRVSDSASSSSTAVHKAAYSTTPYDPDSWLGDARGSRRGKQCRTTRRSRQRGLCKVPANRSFRTGPLLS